jgi:hypothetical protein
MTGINLNLNQNVSSLRTDPNGQHYKMEHIRGLFEQFDRNKDGKLSAEELTQARGAKSSESLVNFFEQNFMVLSNLTGGVQIDYSGSEAGDARNDSYKGSTINLNGLERIAAEDGARNWLSPFDVRVALDSQAGAGQSNHRPATHDASRRRVRGEERVRTTNPEWANSNGVTHRDRYDGQGNYQGGVATWTDNAGISYTSTHDASRWYV